MSETKRSAGMACADCGTVTDRWTHGWDGKYRCMDHARNGRLDALAPHCPTCTCARPTGAAA